MLLEQGLPETTTEIQLCPEPLQRRLRRKKIGSLPFLLHIHTESCLCKFLAQSIFKSELPNIVTLFDHIIGKKVTELISAAIQVLYAK